MRLPVADICKKLGLERTLHPYETQPWLHYDDEQGITCSAEVRMGPGGEDLEIEIQFLYDNPEDHEDEDEGDAGGGRTVSTGKGTSFSDGLDRAEEAAKHERLKITKPKPKRIINGREQILIARCSPVAGELWNMDFLTVRSEDFVNKVNAWEEQGLALFAACINALNIGEMPDIDELIAESFESDKWGGGKKGRIGRKSPKANPAALMGMKK